MRNRSRSATRYLIAAVMSLSTLQVGADECSQSNSNGISSGDVLNIAGVSSTEINTSIGYWSGGCLGYGRSFPNMSAGGSGGVAVSVTHHTGTSTLASGSCGRTRLRFKGLGIRSRAPTSTSGTGRETASIAFSPTRWPTSWGMSSAWRTTTLLPASAVSWGGRPPGGTWSVSFARPGGGWQWESPSLAEHLPEAVDGALARLSSGSLCRSRRLLQDW